ncbi:hypothetical protein EJO69_09980 [Flaviflexus salsibiostraticola]|uniref:Uncharacterized protein n=1 Tax=Flaviflexus salsibiostraticola TaxID=1282737 RepID=A0A3Q8WUG3_9ACTO|nr:hypothetical protein [Flaviflexus salsibiostraticola]AZN30590.1 hypothetical protein EJO69_09980 [Flaviflexus salsibiostraticola]
MGLRQISIRAVPPATDDFSTTARCDAVCGFIADETRRMSEAAYSFAFARRDLDRVLADWDRVLSRLLTSPHAGGAGGSHERR